MMLRLSAAVFGLLLVTMGVVGFYPEITGPKILGLFSISKIDNLVHLISGIVALFCGIQSSYASKVFFIIVGFLASGLALHGFIQGPGVHFGMKVGGLPDLWFQTFIAVISLYFGLFLESD